MIKVEVIEGFTLKNFKLLKNIVRKNADKFGELFVGDIFECDEEMAKYLTGGNSLKKVVVKVIEVISTSKKTEEPIISLNEESIKAIAEQVNDAVKKTTKKKTSKK